MLHNVGLFVSHAAHHKHSYYVIRHSDQLSGFTDAEVEIMAQVARYHRKSAPKSSHVAFAALVAPRQREVRILAGILRIGIALDRTRQGGIQRLEVKISANALEIIAHVDPELDYSLEKYTVDQRVGLLGDSVGLPVAIKILASAEVALEPGAAPA
jgi:exopolyphosphatase/guanosine-5'-triphosphate,3'-diphosphate pyrophosphatase